MDSYRRRQITAVAEAEVKNSGLIELPIDPIQIANRAEIVVQAKPSEMAGASGWLVRSGDGFGILYATHRNNEGFERFSIAHELGHYFLDGHAEHVFRNGERHQSMAGFGSKDRIELEADYFAASLLMPPKLFRREMSRFKDGLKAIMGLREICRTSLEATAIRYAEHTPAAVAIVLSKAGVIQYCVMSDELRELTNSRPRRNAFVPTKSVTHRYIKSANQEEIDSDELPADEWFEQLRGTCTEEVIGLGQTGRVLSILTFEIDIEEDDGLDSHSLTFRR